MPKIYITPHKKIFVWYLTLTILLLASIGYGLFQVSYGTQIFVTAKEKEMEIQFTAQLFLENSVQGEVLETVKEEQRKFEVQSVVKVDDYTEGEILLSNNTWINRTLVATTRFTTPEGLLFRSLETVVIPARGTATVRVKATEKGATYEVEPTTFDIPGLTSSSLKKNILAESTKKMTGGIRKAGIVTEADIARAKQELKEDLIAQAKGEIAEQIQNNVKVGKGMKIATQEEVLLEECDAQPGDEKAEINVHSKVKIAAAVFQEQELKGLAKEKLLGEIPDGQELTSADNISLNYRLASYNQESSVGELEVQCRGTTVVSPDNSILEKSKFTNLTREEIKEYFTIFTDPQQQEKNIIKEVQVRFWPFFLRQSPADPEKIRIIIKR